jgi:hypothetical protein
VNVHHGDDAETPRTMKTPLLDASNVKVVLLHFHRHYPRAARCGSLFGRALVSQVIAMKKHGGHKDLCGLDRRSVIPYIHRESVVLQCVWWSSGPGVDEILYSI